MGNVGEYIFLKVRFSIENILMNEKRKLITGDVVEFAEKCLKTSSAQSSRNEIANIVHSVKWTLLKEFKWKK